MALVFDVQQASGKPETTGAWHRVPLCDTEGLANIIRRDGDCICSRISSNLRATRQTVLIESADHDADLVTYEPDELHHVMRFALDCWQQMIDSRSIEACSCTRTRVLSRAVVSFIRTCRLWVWSRKTAMLR